MSYIIGYLGLSLILLAYILISIGYIDTKHLLYFVINLIGSTLLCYYSFVIGSKPFIILNGCFVLFSIIEIIKVANQKRV